MALKDVGSVVVEVGWVELGLEILDVFSNSNDSAVLRFSYFHFS